MNDESRPPEEQGPDGDHEHDPDLEPATGEDEALVEAPTEEARKLPKWLVPGLIGLVTITAGLLTWRAGQLGSAAAYEDRQSVGQTITQETQRTEAGLATAQQATGYVTYRAGVANAEALEDLAVEAAEQGQGDVAADLLDQAEVTRQNAEALAEASGTFGTQTLLNQQVAGDSGEPFDIVERFDANVAAAATGIASAGVLDPQAWADMAEDTRQRVRELRWATLAMLIAVAAYTVAELARRRPTRFVAFGVGGVVYVATLAWILPGAW